MRSLLLAVVFALLLAPLALAQSSYLFLWAGDDAAKAEDFLAVLDADPRSPTYGQAIASVAVPGPSGSPHHTEMAMPAGGFLLANAFGSGRTMLFDLRDPRRPRLVSSFGHMEGYQHPHTFIRLPNGHILGTFQYHGGHGPQARGGGLVELDAHGKFIRSASAVVPVGPGEIIRPYSLVAIPAADRVISTNTAMHEKDGDSSTIQIWRLSDLKLLHTIALPKGPRGTEQLYPGEPLLALDGKTVLIHTFNCGLYRVDGLVAGTPTAQHVYTFPGKECAVPVRTGNYWVQTLATDRELVTLDISNLDRPKEVSRLAFDDKQKPHWLAVNGAGDRLVMNSGEYAEHRLFLIHLDPKTGALKLDDRFRDPGSNRPGISMDGKKWPHGFQGNAYAHGTVFSH